MLMNKNQGDNPKFIKSDSLNFTQQFQSTQGVFHLYKPLIHKTQAQTMTHFSYQTNT